MDSGEVIVGGKRRQAQEQGRPCLKTQKHNQKHLYLVLDDWGEGYTIRKIDADADGDGRLDLSDAPLLRLASPAPRFRMFFTSLGSRILAASNQNSVTLAYDTDTAALAAGPSLPEALLNGHDIFVPTAYELYAFGRHRDQPQSVEVMSSSSAAEQHTCSGSLIPSRDWSWTSGIPSPFIEDELIQSYAVHPDGRTVFVSTRFCNTRVRRSCTFTFDASNGIGWSFNGDWELPFEGHGYFDSDLDAWVGLDEDGYIGTCQVASRSSKSGTTPEQLDWKIAKDKLWNADAPCEPTLTCMGNARFCLVDYADREEFHGWVLRITTFRLRYSRKGELQIIDRTTSSCPVSKYNTSFSPVAFWM